MASNEDGSTPGDDAGAEKKGGESGNADDQTAADKAKDKGDAGDDKRVIFDSQEALDKVIQNRIDRATKKLEADAKLTKEQQLERDRDEARREVIDRDLRDDFIAESGLSVAQGRRVFLMYKGELEVNDKGKAVNLTDVVKQAKKDFPEIFGSKSLGDGDGGKGGGGKGGSSATGGSMNDAIRRMAGINRD